ncbi:anticodon-binding aminoacyl-tRNA synthetase, class 1a, partial [Tanacetum coccineum]
DVRFRLVIDANDMIERSRCFVSTPGFIHFTLSREWIARSIHKMIKDGIDTWAPKLSVKKAIIYFWSRNIAKKMSMGLSRSTFIGESLALMLEYSRVEPKMIMTKFLIERFPIGEVDDQATGEPEGKSLYDPDISKTLDLLREKGLTIDGEECLHRYGFDMVKADWIVHVTDLGKRDYIQVLMNAAKRAGCIVTDHCQQSKIIYVEFGLVEGDAVERSVDLNDLLDEAKSRCKAKLVGQGTAVVDLEHTAEALGYGAVKYADLKNNRMTNYKFSFDEMLNEKGNTAVYLQYTHARICSITKRSDKKIRKLKKLKERDVENLTLNNDKERQMGVHLLRFGEILSEVCKAAMPHHLCDYLYGLCRMFNTLYPFESKKVCSGEKTGEETSKLLLCEATRVNRATGHRSNNYSESKRNDHLDNNRRQEQRNKVGCLGQPNSDMSVQYVQVMLTNLWGSDCKPGICLKNGKRGRRWRSGGVGGLSRAEAEYRGVANAVAETCWVRNFLRVLHTPLSSATIVPVFLHVPSLLRFIMRNISPWVLPSALLRRFRTQFERFRWSSPLQTAVEYGIIYWRNVDLDEGLWSNYIISFDLKREKFDEVYLPERLAPSHGFLVLAKVNELLRLLEYYNEGEIWVCGVWTKKDGVGKPFKKIYTVKVEGKSLLNSALGWKSVLGFRNNGEDDNDTGYAVEVYEPSCGHISGVGINDKLVAVLLCDVYETLLLLT